MAIQQDFKTAPANMTACMFVLKKRGLMGLKGGLKGGLMGGLKGGLKLKGGLRA